MSLAVFIFFLQFESFLESGGVVLYDLIQPREIISYLHTPPPHWRQTKTFSPDLRQSSRFWNKREMQNANQGEKTRVFYVITNWKADRTSLHSAPFICRDLKLNTHVTRFKVQMNAKWF